MLTSRGWWFLLVVGSMLALSVWTGMTALALVSMTLFVWFFGSLLVFAVRLRLTLKTLQIFRELYDERGPVQNLWAERNFKVHVELYSLYPIPSPYLQLADRLPFGIELVGGQHRADGEIWLHHPLSVTYTIHCLPPGKVRFEGVQVQFADFQGFFYHVGFLRSPREYKVLPAFADVSGGYPTVKRLNILPLIGPHRFRRPGSGSELLDLRDYLPGDPPKSIAWKVSARRDRLITKEFESEVPLRCTFFVDVSASVRAGPPGQYPLVRLTEITSALTQATAAFRDLPGICLFDEQQVRRWIRPNRGNRHIVQIMGVLAETAALSPASAEIPMLSVLPLACAFADEVYPDLMTQEVNHVPWWLPWWAPRSAATIRTAPRQPPSQRRRPAAVLSRYSRRLRRWWRQALVGRLSRVERQRLRWRKKLSAVLAALHDLGPGGLAFLLENDEEFVVHAQRFLAEHNVPFTPPLIGPRGNYLFAAPGKIKVLAKSLTHAVARGKDNEMFVLLADLLELDEHLAPLLNSVKVARARHHQVVVVSPWPAHAAMPEADQPDTPLMHYEKLESMTDLQKLLEQSTTQRLQRAFFKLRRAFGRIGVPMLCAAQQDSVKLVLERLERLRQPVRGGR